MQNLEPGFYYHYKHNPNGEVGNYAYEVLSTAMHTETHEFLVSYRSLYKSELSQYWARPLDMFMESVVKPARPDGSSGADGKEVQRFTKITDKEVIAKLEKIKEFMYP